MSTQLTPAMRRSALIAALRDPTLRPAGFKWDWYDCHQCALGLAEKMLGFRFDGKTAEACQKTNAFFGINPNDALSIFGHMDGPRFEAYPLRSAPTPFMVADRLELLHKELLEQGR